MARLNVASFRAAALITALAVAGCTASLSGDPDRGETGNPSGVGGGVGGTTDEVLAAPASPGAVTLRRLSRTEYDNTVRDLLGTSLEPGKEFPADDLGEQFDTVGSALTLSPLYVLAYERAADALAEELLLRDDEASRAVLRCNVEVSGESCMRSILVSFLPRAFRRPVTGSELDTLLEPYRRAAELGATPKDGLKATIAAALLSPAFLFKLELDDEPDSGKVRTLAPYELATRLSYALWATMPDDELFALAESGELETEDQVSSVIDRMLDDERSRGFTETFVASWLGYRELMAHEVETSLFPTYDAELAGYMQEEASRFAVEFLSSDRPAREMLDAGFTYLNGALAAHYGLSLPPGAETNEMGRVDTTGTTRRGLLTLGAVLTATSYAARTSPVRRGQFVLSRLLCAEVPPPPPGVEGLSVDVTGLSLRERMAVHRADPKCGVCHEVMDPLGFGLEQYDAIGRYRELEGTTPVDATGALPDGTAFDGAIELGLALAQNERFTPCLTHKLVTFAVGRLFPDKDARDRTITPS
jgi:hypothetical protein